MPCTNLSILILGFIWTIGCSDIEMEVEVSPLMVNYITYLDNDRFINVETSKNRTKRKRKAEEILEGHYCEAACLNKDVTMKDIKKIKQQKLFRDNYSDMDVDEIYRLNKGLKTVNETRIRSTTFHIVKSHKRCTQMWKKMTDIYKEILKKYSTFIIGKEIDIEGKEKELELYTFDCLDSFYTNFLTSDYTKEFFFRRQSLNMTVLSSDYKKEFFLKRLSLNMTVYENETSFPYFYKKENISKRNIVSFNKTINSQAISKDLDDLIYLLLFKMATSFEKLSYFKSILLTVFYFYPIDNRQLDDINYMNTLKTLVYKSIVLINIANNPLDGNSEIFKDDLVVRIDEMLRNCLFVYFFGSKNSQQQLRPYKKCQKILEEWSSQNIPLKHDDFVFQYFSIGAHGYLEKNFVNPVLKLGNHMDFYKLSYFYLLKSIERLNRLGEFIIQNEKKFYNI